MNKFHYTICTWFVFETVLKSNIYQLIYIYAFVIETIFLIREFDLNTIFNFSC